MKILKIKKNNLLAAEKILQSGKVVVYPTETVYGLAGDPFSQEAVKKIYRTKGRDFKKPLPLIADSFKTVERFFVLNKKEKELAKKYWPGAVTIILSLNNESKEKFKHFLTTPIKKSKDFLMPPLKGGDNGIAVRISSDKIAQYLAKSLGGFVISTSANVSGASECYSARAVVKQFKNRKFQPDLILDNGVLKRSKPSTIVTIEKGKIKIIRQGEIWISKSVK